MNPAMEPKAEQNSSFATLPKPLKWLKSTYIVKDMQYSGISRQQTETGNPKIQAAMNRKDGRLETAADLTDCVDKDRAAGNVTAEAEFDGQTKTVVKDIPPISNVKDYKFSNTEGPGLVLWEFYSAELSRKAGKHVGLGEGWHLDVATLREKHGYSSVKEPKATLRHNDREFKTGSATSNPLGLLSHAQRKAANVATAAKHAEVNEKISARKQQAEAARAKHNHGALLVCDKCKAEFQRHTWLKKHQDSNCGRHAARVQRRQQLINESTEKRLEALDEAELQEIFPAFRPMPAPTDRTCST